jgi:hypothetical protein
MNTMISRLELLKKATQLAHDMVNNNSVLNDIEYAALKATYPEHPELAAQVLAEWIIDDIVNTYQDRRRRGKPVA